MKKCVITLGVFGSTLSSVIGSTIGFSGFTMDFVDVGDAGNAADDTGYGAVDYNYRMGTHEVSRAMIDAYNGDVANASNQITMQNLNLVTGGVRAAMPSTGVSWNEAARFVNWLNTSQGHSVAYRFTTTGGNANIALWDAASAGTGFNAANPFRNTNAVYYLPTENEGYKAAYYNGGSSSYWDYATQSDTAPTAVTGGTAAGSAVYSQTFEQGPADISNAGGLSYYGTMAQGGNVWEWSESAFFGSTNLAGNQVRTYRGGDWLIDSGGLQSSNRAGSAPTNEADFIGFRVAAAEAVPEPSGLALLAIGTIVGTVRRKRC